MIRNISVIVICLIFVSCSSTPKPADVSHCLTGAKSARYNCVFNAHRDHFDAIYSRHFSDSQKVSGRITFVLSITRDGSIAEVHIGKSTIKSDAFENEMLSYILHMNFGMGMAQHTIRIIDFPISD